MYPHSLHSFTHSIIQCPSSVSSTNFENSLSQSLSALSAMSKSSVRSPPSAFFPPAPELPPPLPAAEEETSAMFSTTTAAEAAEAEEEAAASGGSSTSQDEEGPTKVWKLPGAAPMLATCPAEACLCRTAAETEEEVSPTRSTKDRLPPPPSMPPMPPPVKGEINELVCIAGSLSAELWRERSLRIWSWLACCCCCCTCCCSSPTIIMPDIAAAAVAAGSPSEHPTGVEG